LNSEHRKLPPEHFFHIFEHILENNMIQSMTGFGKASLQLPNKKITVEVKSLNSKGLDVSIRMPSSYREMELGLRNQIALKLERGKIDFSVFIESTAEQTSTKVNVPIVKAYIEQLRDVYGAKFRK
jgi:uncharacterized protein (TIGR00255 family)